MTFYDGNVIETKMKNSFCPLFSFVYRVFNGSIYCNASNEVKEAFQEYLIPSGKGAYPSGAIYEMKCRF